MTVAPTHFNFTGGLAEPSRPFMVSRLFNSEI